MRKESDRGNVCEAFAIYLEDPLNANLSAIGKQHGVRHLEFYEDSLSRELVLSTLNKLENALRMGSSLRLCCYCRPKFCHGDVIAEYLR
eukprot:8986344-Karenia_brevis.AAC.1